MPDIKMKGTEYFSGQLVVKEDLERDSMGLAEEMGIRTIDILHTSKKSIAPTGWSEYYLSGIMHSLKDGTSYSGLYDFALSRNAGNLRTFNVGVGTAYDIYGRLIQIPSGETITYFSCNPDLIPPISTGNYAIPLVDYTDAHPNYIYAKWVEIRDTGITSINPVDGSLHYISRLDGYAILVNTTAPAAFFSIDANKIYTYLGNILGNGTGDIVVGEIDLDIENRRYLSVAGMHVRGKVSLTTAERPIIYLKDKMTTFEEHIRAIEDPNLISPSNPHGLTTGGGGVPDPLSVGKLTVTGATAGAGEELTLARLTGTQALLFYGHSSYPSSITFLSADAPGGTSAIDFYSDPLELASSEIRFRTHHSGVSADPVMTIDKRGDVYITGHGGEGAGLICANITAAGTVTLNGTVNLTGSNTNLTGSNIANLSNGGDADSLHTHVVLPANCYNQYLGSATVLGSSGWQAIIAKSVTIPAGAYLQAWVSAAQISVSGGNFATLQLSISGATGDTFPCLSQPISITLGTVLMTGVTATVGSQAVTVIVWLRSTGGVGTDEAYIIGGSMLNIIIGRSL